MIAAGLALAILGSAYAGYAWARQVHMHNALDHLQAAKAELKKATHNKGGHRKAAIALVNDAIDQVKKGIKDGRS